MAGVGYAASVPDLPPQVAETDEEAFRGYARDATSRMVTTLCWLLGAAVLVLWPLDWLLFADDPRAREIFLWGRTTFLALTAATLALLRLRAWAQRWSGEIFLFNCAVGCALAGLGCARLGGLELPWYYATYALPALTVPVLMPLGRRVAATLALPLVWSAAFFLSRPAAFEGFALLGIFGFQSATVGGAVAVGHLVYRLTRRDFLAQRLIRRTFGRYFSRDVADALLMSERGELEAEDRVATILFSDLVGYSSLVERLPPGSVIEMLNRYFSAMHEVIRNHHGTVLEYVGDGIMVVFGAPRDLPDHAVHATRCAMEMRAMLAALNHDWQLEGLASLWRDQGGRRPHRADRRAHRPHRRRQPRQRQPHEVQRGRRRGERGRAPGGAEQDPADRRAGERDRLPPAPRVDPRQRPGPRPHRAPWAPGGGGGLQPVMGCARSRLRAGDVRGLEAGRGAGLRAPADLRRSAGADAAAPRGDDILDEEREGLQWVRVRTGRRPVRGRAERLTPTELRRSGRGEARSASFAAVRYG